MSNLTAAKVIEIAKEIAVHSENDTVGEMVYLSDLIEYLGEAEQ